jgi:lipoic acid synthetase
VRAGADYDRSLAVLARGAAAGVVTKTSLMLGLGEDDDEVAEAMRDARAAGCDIVYLGQYLRPSWRQRPVARYVEPAAFDRLRERGLALGIPVVVAAPLVRSSYHSEEQRRYLEQRGLYERGAVAVGAERGGGAG